MFLLSTVTRGHAEPLQPVSVVNLLVLYTPRASAGAGGTNSILEQINTAVMEANTVFQNSRINARVHLALAAGINYLESGSVSNDLARLRDPGIGILSQAHRLRDQFRADLVCLITETGSDWWFYGLQGPSADNAFSIVRRPFLTGGYYFPVALSFNFGCQLERPYADSVGAFAYAYGHSFWVGDTPYSTVEAFSGQRIPFFSNPGILFQGVPIGVPAGVINSANNALVMNQTAPTVAAFRGSALVTLPPRVNITAPGDGAKFRSGTNVILTANATDPDGKVVRIDYYEGTNLLASSGTPPFRALWRKVPVGEHSPFAVATDNAGATTISLPIHITVVPTNDDFVARSRLVGTTNTVRASNILATAEPAEPNHAGFPAAHSLWWTYTAPADGVVRLDASASGFVASLAVYTGSALNALAEVASTSGIDESAVRFEVAAGQAYQFALDSPDGETGDFELHLSFAPAPANDNFVHRQLLNGNSIRLRANNQGATREADEPNHSDTLGSASLWWSWTAPADGPFSLTINSSRGANLLLGVYTGDALTNLSPVPSQFQYPASFVLTAEKGVSYQIAVDSPVDPLQPGSFELDLSFTPAPRNDDFANRTPIRGAWISLTNSSTLATLEPGEPAHDYTAWPSIWWSWTAPISGSVTISSPTYSYFDIYVGGSLTNLTPVAGGSPATFDAVAGTTYAIAASGPPGSVVLNLSVSTVWLTNPMDGTRIAVGSNVRLQASITPNDGSIAQVEFFANGQSLGSVLRPPYSLVWKKPLPGSYSVTAAARDRMNHVRSSHPSLITVGPVNDDFANRTIITGSWIALTNTMVMATLEPTEPAHGDTGFPSIWWSWKAPNSGSVTVTSSSLGYLDVYVGTSLTSLTSVAGGSPVTFDATVGTTYCIAASGLPAGDMTIGLVLYALPLASPTNGARFPVGSDIRLEATPPTNRAPIVQVEFFADGRSLGAVSQARFSLSWKSPSPGAYYVTAVASDVQNNTLRSRPSLTTVTPGNDNFADRTMIAGSTLALTNSLAGATSEPGEPTLAGSRSNSIWWSWTAPASGLVTLFFPGGQSFGVFLGSAVSNLTRIASGCGEGSFEAIEGTSYAIRASGTPDRVVFQLTLSTLRITSPANGAQIIGGRDLQINIGATAMDGALKEVEVLADGVSLGVTTNAPFALVWSNVPPGNFELTVVGTSDQGVAHKSPAVSISVVPTNDYFANRITLNGSSVVVGGDTTYATWEYGEPFQGFYQQSLWYSWTAPWSGDFVLAINYILRPPLYLTVYSGAVLASLNTVAENHLGTVTPLHTLAGRTYQIAVAYVAGSGIVPPWESFTLTIQPRPPNDDFDHRIALTNLSLPILANNLGATAEPGEPGCPSCVGQSVWWTWVAPHSGRLIFDASTRGYSPELHLYAGTSISNLFEVPPVPRYGAQNLAFQVTGGCAYQIAADGNWNPDWSIAFTLAFSPGPDNDDFGNRLVLAGTNATTTGGSSLATSEPGEPNHAGTAAGRSVWYSWTAPARGALTVTSTTSGPTPVLAVYSGTSVSNLNPVASTATTRLTFMADRGATYAIAVDGGPGLFSLHLALTAAPGNDYFVNRQPLHGLLMSMPGSTRYATLEPGESWGGWEVDRSVWYSWTAPADGLVRVRCPSHLVAVCTGDSVSNLLAVASAAFDARDFQAVAGTEYEFGVATPPWYWLPDDFTLALEMPKVQIISPTNGAAFPLPANLEIVARTIDIDGAVVSVSFFDGTNLLATVTNAPFQMEYHNAPAGSYVLSLQATDENGVTTTSDAIEVRVKPANDDLAQSILINGPSPTFAADNSGATSEQGESLPGGASGRTLWWSWTAPSNSIVTIATSAFSAEGAAATPTPKTLLASPPTGAEASSVGPKSVIIIGPGYDNPPGPTTGPLLNIYTGTTLTNLSLCASNSTWFSSWFVPGEWCVLPSVSFPVIGGQTYQLSLDGVNGSFGSATVAFSLAPPPVVPTPAVNDNFAQATLLWGSSLTMTGTTVAATRQPGEPSHGVGPGDRTVWYSWTAPASGAVQAGSYANNSGGGMALGIYAGYSLWNLIPVTTGIGEASFYALAGTTYRIAVVGPDGLGVDFSLALEAPPPPPIIDAAHTVRLPNGSYRVRVTGGVGQSFVVQASSDSRNWVTVRTDTLSGNYLDFVDTAAAAFRQRLYRVLSFDAAFNDQPFVLLAPSIQSDAGFSLHLAGMAGQPFRLQASTNCLDWSDLTGGILGNETFGFTDQDSPKFNCRFYRALKQ